MFHQSVEQSQSHVTNSRDPVGVDNDRDNGDGDDSGFMFSDCWDDFFISRTTVTDPSNRSEYPIPNANDDLEWEEIDDHAAFNMVSEPEPDLDEQPNSLEWEFLDNDSSSSGRPPASITVVENLSSVVITGEDYENRNTLCAVCKDEIGIGLTAKRLPCDHLYHGDCILPWLEIRNTCPVCRHELLTDDLDYERRKAERGAGD
ncbi:hypothetical protein L1987_23316 [Smallanthus sonchifolius]|uniref:Uncharacterized protein n=1 Tax=Smallanthus sonchifolius TaxID=185202 RepID=A0ACB9IHB1_9ASTR|nr:hypothetical protein L1987_23316 [Smallanthus sonchifolius]